MWPWEHVAVGYLAYSGLVRARTDRAPTGAAVVWLVLGTQFPDLVDKPLAWWLGVLPSGSSLAHSIFVALPVVALALVVGRRSGNSAAGAAFGVGYLSHLPADALYPVLLGGRPAPGVFLWPLVETTAPEVGIATRVGALFAQYLAALASPAGVGYVVAELLLLGAALAAWVADGAPGPRAVATAVGSLISPGER